MSIRFIELIERSLCILIKMFDRYVKYEIIEEPKKKKKKSKKYEMLFESSLTHRGFDDCISIGEDLHSEYLSLIFDNEKLADAHVFKELAQFFILFEIPKNIKERHSFFSDEKEEGYDTFFEIEAFQFAFLRMIFNDEFPEGRRYDRYFKKSSEIINRSTYYYNLYKDKFTKASTL